MTDRGTISAAALWAVCMIVFVSTLRLREDEARLGVTSALQGIRLNPRS